MFGHQEEPQQPATDTSVTTPDPVSDGTLDDNLAALATSSDDVQAVPDPTPLVEAHETDGYIMADAPGSTPQIAPPSNDDTSTSTPVAATTDTNTLLDIKQQALQQLSPLVGHLDQSPEEKFRTTMMMIQASDNQSLIQTAYEAAQSIPDEKAKAQALLDIVNEINYFTQHHNS